MGLRLRLLAKPPTIEEAAIISALIVSLALVFQVLTASPAAAASFAECEAYLCLPGGFPPSECNAAHTAVLRRLAALQPSLPPWSECAGAFGWDAANLQARDYWHDECPLGGTPDTHGISASTCSGIDAAGCSFSYTAQKKVRVRLTVDGSSSFSPNHSLTYTVSPPGSRTVDCPDFPLGTPIVYDNPPPPPPPPPGDPTPCVGPGCPVIEQPCVGPGCPPAPVIDPGCVGPGCPVIEQPCVGPGCPVIDPGCVGPGCPVIDPSCVGPGCPVIDPGCANPPCDDEDVCLNPPCDEEEDDICENPCTVGYNCVDGCEVPDMCGAVPCDEVVPCAPITYSTCRPVGPPAPTAGPGGFN